MTTAQPAAGTAIHSDWTTSLVFARNEVETTASTLAAGSYTRSIPGVPGVNDPQWSTDGDGRYKYAAGTDEEQWSGGTGSGSEFTLMCIVKRVANGTDQFLTNADDGANRAWQWAIHNGGYYAGVFDSSNTLIGSRDVLTAPSTSALNVMILRVRNDGGTYKLVLSLNGTPSAEGSLSGTPRAWQQRFAIINRLDGGANPLVSNLYFSACWTRALSDTEMSTLGANGWAIYDAQGGGGSSSGAAAHYYRQLMG